MAYPPNQDTDPATHDRAQTVNYPDVDRGDNAPEYISPYPLLDTNTPPPRPGAGQDSVIPKEARLPVTPPNYLAFEVVTTTSQPQSTEALGGQLGFPARAITIDNLTNQWVYTRNARRFTPPYTIGAIWPIADAAEIASLRFEAPGGANFTQAASIASERVILQYWECELDPSPGRPVSAASAAAATTVAGTKTPADTTTTPTDAVDTEDFNMVFNGTTWDRERSASASTLTNAGASLGVVLVAPISTWSVTATAAAAQATVSKAAGAAGVRHVATSIHASFAAGATPGVATQVNLRDGATGAGTILWSGVLAATAGNDTNFSLNGLAITGTAATAMTLEFAAAGAATTVQNVSLTGYDVS